MKKTQNPPRFDVLAVYNAEVYRGIMHTKEWELRMYKLQAEYYDWLSEMYGIDKDALYPRNQGQPINRITP